MKGGFDIPSCSNPYLKVKALRTIEEKFDIDISSGAINGEDGPIELDECIFKLARANHKQKKPSTKQELIKFYITGVKHCAASEIVEPKQISHGKNRKKYDYTLDRQVILHHLELNSLKNCRLANVKKQYKFIYFNDRITKIMKT